jgi:hypothetical protein
MRKVATGCHRVGGVVVTCQSWWHTDTCASTVGVHHCSTPTSVKHSNQYTNTRKFRPHLVGIIISDCSDCTTKK